jgi:GINS complex subunit 3
MMLDATAFRSAPLLRDRQIKALSKAPIPLWLSYIVLYSFVSCLDLKLVLCIQLDLRRDWADFVVPSPFTVKVRNALKAEARSVKLSQLVGAGGTWYGFGKAIMDL